MKIAVCAQSDNTNATVDTRFGRAGAFAIFDTDSNQWTFAPNQQNLQAAQGAGIQAAQSILNTGAEVLLAANVGPKAVAALQTGSVDIYQVDASMTIQQAVADYTDGKLTQLTTANVEGHWA